MNNSALANQIYEKALSCGFDSCGIIPIDRMDSFTEYFQKRTEAVPSSGIFYKAVGIAEDIKSRFPWAKSVVICTLWLGKYRFPPSLQGLYAKNLFLSPGNELSGKPCRSYRKLEDWFSQAGIRAAGGKQFGATSIGPLRHAAMMAGLGIIRKNNFFYTEKGSFVELVGYVIDRECQLIQTPHLKPCPEKCDLCQRSCPCGALKAPYTMSPLDCVSYLTTFGKGQLPPGTEEKQMGLWICGCDSCQDACPFNRRHDWTSGEKYPGLEEIEKELQPERMLEQTDKFLQQYVIPYTDHHIAPNECDTLRLCAARSLRNRT